MNEISEIQSMIRAFCNERDWSQYHNGKDLALALSIESAEINELFLWKNPKDVRVADLKNELADVLYYALLLASHYNLDVKDIIENKLKLNAEKYPIEKSKGTAKKYTEL